MLELKLFTFTKHYKSKRFTQPEIEKVLLIYFLNDKTSDSSWLFELPHVKEVRL